MIFSRKEEIHWYFKLCIVCFKYKYLMPYGKLFINLACSICTEKKDLGPLFPCTDLAFGDSLRLIETLRLTFTANGINFKYFKVISTRFRQLSPIIHALILM